MTTKNEEIFQKALETLKENDRKVLEAFAQFLMNHGSSGFTDQDATNTSMTSILPITLVQKANEALLKDYVQLKVDYIEYSAFAGVEIFFNGRDRAQSFPSSWFELGCGILTDRIDTLFVKFRPGSNRIDKVALDARYLTPEGKAESKKRILALNLDYNSVSTSSVVLPPTPASPAFTTSIPRTSDGWGVTSAIVSVAVPKTHSIFAKIDSVKEGRLRLSRVGEILFNFLDQSNDKKYVWDSEFFFGAKHDFTNVKTGQTYDIKCYFRANDRLQLSESTLKNCDANYIVGVLVEENNSEYIATISGYISKSDFTSKTTPWAYNEHVTLRSLELHELNSPQDLF